MNGLLTVPLCATNDNSSMSGVWVSLGKKLSLLLSMNWKVDYELYAYGNWILMVRRPCHQNTSWRGLHYVGKPSISTKSLWEHVFQLPTCLHPPFREREVIKGNRMWKTGCKCLHIINQGAARCGMPLLPVAKEYKPEIQLSLHVATEVTKQKTTLCQTCDM